jgi:hypothetical protein
VNREEAKAEAFLALNFTSSAVSQKFMAFVLHYPVCREFPKSRSFGSAEVRFAQDDRSFFDINI